MRGAGEAPRLRLRPRAAALPSGPSVRLTESGGSPLCCIPDPGCVLARGAARTGPRVPAAPPSRRSPSREPALHHRPLSDPRGCHPLPRPGPGLRSGLQAGGSGRKHCAVSSFISQRKGESSGPGAISGLTPAPTAGPPWPWCPDRKFRGIVMHLWRPPSSLPQMVSGDN